MSNKDTLDILTTTFASGGRHDAPGEIQMQQVNSIYTVYYFKLSNKWYLHFPPHLEKGGSQADLERTGCFYEFLEQVASGTSVVRFHMSAQPFDDADVMTFTRKGRGTMGAYYRLERFEEAELGYELWMSTGLYQQQKQLLSNIYIKRIS